MTNTTNMPKEMQDFLKKGEALGIYPLEWEYSTDRSTVVLDWSSLALKVRHEQADKARKQSEIDRVLWNEDDILVRYPWREFEDFPFSNRDFERNPAMLNPVMDKSKHEILIVDKKVIAAVKKKYEDCWEPCNGMCGDPDHLEYQDQELANGFIWDNSTLSKTIEAKKLSQAVKIGEKALAELVELGV